MQRESQQGGKDGERSKRRVERVERNDKGYQGESAGSRRGHDEPYAFKLYSQSEDLFQACHWGLQYSRVIKFTH